MRTKKDLSIIYDNWYAYGFGSPTEDQKNNFWLEVFNTEDDEFIKSKILDSDLDKILIQYIQYISAQRNLNFPEVMEIFSLWWTDVLSEHKQKCAHVLHSLLSDKDLPTGAEEQNEKRIKDMIQSEQWDNALIHHKPIEYPSHAQHSWAILNFIMKERRYTDQQWNETLNKIDVYLKCGGLWEENPPIPEQCNHILLTSLATKVAENNDTQKLWDLYKRGINPNSMTVWPIPSFGKKDFIKDNLINSYNQYLHHILTQAVEDVEYKNISTRKM